MATILYNILENKYFFVFSENSIDVSGFYHDVMCRDTYVVCAVLCVDVCFSVRHVAYLNNCRPWSECFAH
jgi:hypothetical protein